MIMMLRTVTIRRTDIAEHLFVLRNSTDNSGVGFYG